MNWDVQFIPEEMRLIVSPHSEIDRITRLQEDLLSRHVVKSSEEIRKDIERDKILTATEAVEYGIIDQVLASRKAKK